MHQVRAPPTPGLQAASGRWGRRWTKEESAGRSAWAPGGEAGWGVDERNGAERSLDALALELLADGERAGVDQVLVPGGWSEGREEVSPKRKCRGGGRGVRTGDGDAGREGRDEVDRSRTSRAAGGASRGEGQQRSLREGSRGGATHPSWAQIDWRPRRGTEPELPLQQKGDGVVSRREGCRGSRARDSHAGAVLAVGGKEGGRQRSVSGEGRGGATHPVVTLTISESVI